MPFGRLFHAFWIPFGRLLGAFWMPWGHLWNILLGAALETFVALYPSRREKVTKQGVGILLKKGCSNALLLNVFYVFRVPLGIILGLRGDQLWNFFVKFCGGAAGSFVVTFWLPFGRLLDAFWEPCGRVSLCPWTRRLICSDCSNGAG